MANEPRVITCEGKQWRVRVILIGVSDVVATKEGPFPQANLDVIEFTCLTDPNEKPRRARIQTGIFSRLTEAKLCNEMLKGAQIWNDD